RFALPSFPTRRSSDLRVGRSVRSLTQRTSCGRVKRRCAYQSPSLVDGGLDAVSSLVASRFRSFAVHRSLNMRLFGLTVSQAQGLDRKSTRLNSSHEWI